MKERSQPSGMDGGCDGEVADMRGEMLVVIKRWWLVKSDGGY